MNDELQRELASWLSGLRSTAGQAGGFVVDQAPEVLREMLVQGRFYATAWMIAWLAALIGGAILFRSEEFWSTDEFLTEDDKYNWLLLGYCLLAAWVVLMLAWLLLSGGYFVTVWFAPRVYLIDRLAAIVNH